MLEKLQLDIGQGELDIAIKEFKENKERNISMTLLNKEYKKIRKDKGFLLKWYR